MTEQESLNILALTNEIQSSHQIELQQNLRNLLKKVKHQIQILTNENTSKSIKIKQLNVRNIN